MTGPTPNQLKVFWRQFGAACRELGLISKVQRDEYRHRIMQEECHVNHLKDVGHLEPFEHLMTRVSMDAQDYSAAAEWSVGEDKRMAELALDEARQIGELVCRTTDPTDYLRGIIKQSKMINPDCLKSRKVEDWFADIGVVDTRRLFQMLDVHRRRVLGKLRYTGSLSYRFRQSWVLLPDGKPVPLDDHA